MTELWLKRLTRLGEEQDAAGGRVAGDRREGFEAQAGTGAGFVDLFGREDVLAHADLDLGLAVEAQGGIAVGSLAARFIAKDHLTFAAKDIDGSGAVPTVGVTFGED